MTIDDERAAALRRRYIKDQVETASPPQRLLMLLGRLARDLQAAHDAFDSGGIEAIHVNLLHAQQIVLVLRDSLAGSDWTGAGPLRSVYTFAHQRLVECNVRKDRALLPACITIVGKILDANTRALTEMETRRTEMVGAVQVA